MRRGVMILVAAAVAVGAGGWLAIGASGQNTRRAPAPALARAAAAAPASAKADTGLPPLPKMRGRVVQPKAGAGVPVAPAATTAAGGDTGLGTAGPTPRAPASAGARNVGGFTGAGSVHAATALPNGIAVPPLEAPDSVMRMIQAGNVIARSPYIWGGGHGKWLDKGYDCSGSVSFVLASAGYLSSPLDSGHLANWGLPGPGKWVTIYANATHTFMYVAGLRFDTVGQAVTGSRWQNAPRSFAGFAVRHPPGL